MFFFQGIYHNQKSIKIISIKKSIKMKSIRIQSIKNQPINQLINQTINKLFNHWLIKIKKIKNYILSKNQSKKKYHNLKFSFSLS